MIEKLLLFLGILLLINGIYRIIKYFLVRKYIPYFLSDDVHEIKEVDFNKIFVLAPVLHEEDTIESFLIDILNQDFPKDKYELCIVTTQKEFKKDLKSKNTIDIINDLLEDDKFSDLNINVYHYPNSYGFKSNQLNFAFNSILKEHEEENVRDSFFLLLDVDSKVDRLTLSRFNNSIESEVQIYQQPLVWFKNFNDLSNFLMKSFSFLQTFFSVSYEIPMFKEMFFSKRLKYFVGHGLFLKGSFILDIGGFPDIIEDIRMGRLSSFLDCKVRLVPGFGSVETAKNFFVHVKQASVWFFGCSLLIKDYLLSRSLRDKEKISYRDMILIFYGFLKEFRWLNESLFHFLGLIVSLILNLKFIFILFFLSLVLNSVIPAAFIAKDFKMFWKTQSSKNNFLSLIQILFFSPVFYLISFVGPYFGLLKVIKFYLWDRKIVLPKTER